MFLPLSAIKVPTHGTHHYFFYGACTEDQLSPMIAAAEKAGCEFLSLVPMQMPMQKSRLALHNGNAPQFVTIFRIFVRCVLTEFPTVRERMEKDAQENDVGGERLFSPG